MTRGASDKPDQAAASTSARIVGVPLTGPVPGVVRRRGRERIPPPAVVPDLHEPRHQHAPDERRDPGRPLLHGRLRGVELEPGIGLVVEPLGERRLPVPCRLGRPSLAPGHGRLVRDLPMRAGQPGQGPGPRHDPIRVVAATARREPAAPGVSVRERVHEPRRRAMRGRGHVQVGERVPGVRIGAVLGHDEIGRERGGQLGEQQRNRSQPRPLAGPGRQRHVDAGPGRHPLPHLVDVAGPREQRAARSRGTRSSARPDRPSASPAPRRRDAHPGRCTSPAARHAAPGRSPAPGRRRCRTPTRAPASRDAARHPGAGRAPRPRAGSPRPREATHRRPPPMPRACRRTAGSRHPRRCPPPGTRTGRPRSA